MKINDYEKKKPLGLYIHIPFCIRKCNYCDFLSMSGNDTIWKAYVDHLILELKSYKKMASSYLVNTIYIGGGTPSSIPAHYIEEILAVVRQVFSIIPNNSMEGLPEITIEANPGTLTKDKLDCYKRVGINRLSMGLQSIHNHQLKLLGRIHTYEDFLDNYNLARTVGFDNISIDLMSALPGQNVKDWMDTLEEVVKLNPQHISAYSLIVEEGTPFYDCYGTEEGEELLPTEETERELYSITNEILGKAGFRRYEISNYGRAGYESKHNSSYWRGIEYLGIGLGASSLLNQERYQNVTSLDQYMDYLKKNQSIRMNIEPLTKQNQMEEFMFLGLRMMDGVSKSQFQHNFSNSMDDIYGETIKKYEKLQLLAQTDDRIFLTEQGIDVCNQIFADFLLDS